MLHISADRFGLLPAFAKITCEPGWKWARREHPMSNYDLFYVWGGEGELWLGETRYALESGSCLLFRPGDHTCASHNPQKPLVLSYIHFTLEGGDEPQLVPSPYRVLRDRQLMETLLARYVRLRLSGGFGAEEEAKLLLKQMMIHLLREERQGTSEQRAEERTGLEETIREIANFVRQHAAEAHTIEALAERANLSPRYFSHKFKQLIGQSVQSYVIRARIERAEHLLHYAGMSVTEVAEALGYRDVFFFSRQFKQYTGKSPSALK
ncbi:helix-turn-helix transcriptional regulator [Paenibacillus athensensis]|uniref:HTH araC/xylS-type domain-containing protein n=1 Tax=Paenibacillus athensensis TaxID=1967502 RepID=A0A4Y8PXD7_9BACL|nr:AraC family transcriptional regulator [Paenibacillus athensensis]MCD1258044.1 helix-turn-helix transcriptional regulator [Paenibacillus athensensis]